MIVLYDQQSPSRGFNDPFTHIAFHTSYNEWLTNRLLGELTSTLKHTLAVFVTKYASLTKGSVLNAVLGKKSVISLYFN